MVKNKTLMMQFLLSSIDQSHIQFVWIFCVYNIVIEYRKARYTYYPWKFSEINCVSAEMRVRAAYFWCSWHAAMWRTATCLYLLTNDIHA